MATSLGPTFSAGGIMSGLDTNTIVDKLTELAARPVTNMKGRQAAFQTQISSLGEIVGRLSSLQDAAAALGTNGVLGVKAIGTNTAFTATPASAATAGRYEVAVTNLAAAAQARSQAFAGPTAAVRGGTLSLNVQGTVYDITIGDGAALSDVALAIRQSGAPVSATVLSDGTNSYLSITNRATGYTIGSAPATALSISETSTGTLGQALLASIIKPAENATFTIDGLGFTRTSNTVADAIPGTTLSLKTKSVGGLEETLLLDNDSEATSANLQKFVDAYNRAMELVQKQLAVTPTTDRMSSLAGDTAVRRLQSSLSSLISTTVGTTAFNSLTTLGIQTNRDGSVTLDKTKLANAMSKDASAVNNIFQATSGVAAAVKSLVDHQTNAVNGILTQDKKSLSDRISQMNTQIDSLQRRVDAYHDTLVKQFTAMETIISRMKSTGSFLSAREKASQQ